MAVNSRIGDDYMHPHANVPRAAYLSAADRQTESFVDPGRLQSSFEASLLQNILFESAVLIPDIFYFISAGLASHIRNRSLGNANALLETGISQGAVIPAFRDPDISSFKDSYELVKSQGIRGLLGEDDCAKIIRNLDLAVEEGKDKGTYRYTSWPTVSVGGLFENRLTSFFQPGEDIVPIDKANIRGIWDRTQLWRYDCLDEARAIGAESGGFRRGDYMAAIGRSFGLSSPIDDISQLFNFPGLSGEDARALRALCMWMNECYQYSQARAFGVDPNWARFHPDLSMVTLAAMEHFDEDNTLTPELVETTVVARVPPPRVLLGMDASKLLSVRTEKAGKLYFRALNEWREEPFSDVATRAVNEEFKNYARVLRDMAAGQGQYTDTPLRQRLVRLDGPRRSLAVTGATAVASVASYGSHLFTPFVALGGLAYATYIWGTERSQNLHYTLKAPVEVSVAS